MPIKKSELYSSLWKSCDELRGGMDASQYKDYILVLLFVKYVSDKYAGQKDSMIDVPAGGSFADMVQLKGDKNIGESINTIIGKLAEANGLKGVIDVADFDADDKLGKGKEKVDRLSSLIGIFESSGLDFRSNRADGDDLLGDAYEYLMRHFATESGKSKGQFYTPAEVSRIMARVIGINLAKSSSQTIYDPTCGSGSLLLKAHDEARSRTGVDITIYGQEMDNATAALARMNMILHDCPSAEIWQGNTISHPHFKDRVSSGLRTFDFVVANPPFSNKAWSRGIDPTHDLYHRFDLGIPPVKNGDYAFLLHLLASMKSNGKGAIIMPHGVLFRGNTEAGIRKEIISRGFIKGIIGLPPNLFYGTQIPACIIVLDKENAFARKGVFMIDASKGFIKDGNKNRLRDQDIHKIVDIFNRQVEIPKYSRMIPRAEIADAKNDYNLNIPRYIDSTEPEDLQDIDAHLNGGIPNTDLDALDRYWDIFPTLRSRLFKRDRPGYSQLKVAQAEIKAAISSHSEFDEFNKSATRLFNKWLRANTPQLMDIKVGGKPKRLIEGLSEDLLETFQKVRLLDPYDIYQHLMDYWGETMQDDVYMIVSDGWKEAAKPQQILVDKENKTKVKPDFSVGKLKFKAELVLRALLINRYFSAEQKSIEEFEAKIMDIERVMEEMAEEDGGEDGLLEEVQDEKGKISKKAVSSRMKEIKDDPEMREEEAMIQSCLLLLKELAAVGQKLKEAEKALESKLAAKYGRLSEEEIKSLVVNDKWLATLSTAVQTELDRVSQSLTGRIRQLAERYASPLPEITTELKRLASRVDSHLKKMGAVWK